MGIIRLMSYIAFASCITPVYLMSGQSRISSRFTRARNTQMRNFASVGVVYCYCVSTDRFGMKQYQNHYELKDWDLFQCTEKRICRCLDGIQHTMF